MTNPRSASLLIRLQHDQTAIELCFTTTSLILVLAIRLSIDGEGIESAFNLLLNFAVQWVTEMVTDFLIILWLTVVARQPVLALTNQHAAGTWAPRGLSRAARADLDVAQRLDALATCLQDRGGDGRHAVCKHGYAYRTVSSSLLALPWDRAVAATWRYAEGPPDVTAFRDYGDLSAQL